MAIPSPTPLPGRLIGYARVSTDDQGTDPQRDELHAAGCHEILEEHASGADRTRPVLARLLRDIRQGDTLVVVRLDRLARSVSHLLAVIEQLEAAGGFATEFWPSSDGEFWPTSIVERRVSSARSRNHSWTGKPKWKYSSIISRC